MPSRCTFLDCPHILLLGEAVDEFRELVDSDAKRREDDRELARFEAERGRISP